MKKACSRWILTGVFLAAIGAFAAPGCAPRRAEVSLPVEIPEAFSDSGEHEAPSLWWTAFGDPELNRLVEGALESNFDLETAWHRLREAQAVVDREASLLFPDLDGEAAGELRRPESEENERLLLGLASFYEVDLWGRIRSSVEAERYRARATRDDYRTAALSLSAEVARVWFQLIEARGRRDLLEAQVETNLKVLRLIRARFGSGLVRGVDILRQNQLVESTREQKISAESSIRVLEHLLAVLLGRPPRAGTGSIYGEMPQLPPLPETGVPLELVRRRPDIRSAWHLLRAADRDLAAAISSRYPRLTLSASVFTADDTADDLFVDWITAIGANVVGPIFDGGLRRSEVDRTEAVRNQALYAYAQSTLTAFQEVEDALIREKKQIERIGSIEEQVRLAVQAYEQLRIEYFNGVTDYIDVLTALTDEQQLRRDLLLARRELLEFRIALYRALAGGFETGRKTGGAPSGLPEKGDLQW